MVMLSTFAVSLGLSVKEGLFIGFVLSVLKTMSDLGNPNLAVCGRLPDNTFRDVRNFPNAELMEKAVIIRMDARLSFANARKLKEFCLRAVQLRVSQGADIQYLIIDGKSINHVDLTGCEMLEMLAESLDTNGHQLILANLKGPVSKCLASAGVPAAIMRHKGHLCIDMDQAISIANGGDPKKACEMMDQLVKRVETAKLLLQQNGAFYACGAPKGICSNAQVGTATASTASTEANSPVNGMSKQTSPSSDDPDPSREPPQV